MRRAIQAVVYRFAAQGINLHVERGPALPHSHVISFRMLGRREQGNIPIVFPGKFLRIAGLTAPDRRKFLSQNLTLALNWNPKRARLG